MKSALLAACLLAALSAPLQAQEGPFLTQSFAETRVAAEKSHRLVMLDFYTTWCGPCKLLDKVTWRDPAVLAWLEKNTLCLKIDAEKDVELAKR